MAEPTPTWNPPDLPAWERAAALFDWAVEPTRLWEPGPREGRWFTAGRLCLTWNLVERHARRDPSAIALHWEGEPGDSRTVTYAALLDDVTVLARALRHLGVRRGDVVSLHLGALPELVTAMLATIRVGAAFMVIPAPLPVEGLAERLGAVSPKVLITQDGAWRRGVVLPLKARADDALAAVPGIEHTIVVRRTGMDVAWYEGDRWYHDLAATARPGNRRTRTEPTEPASVDDRLLVTTVPQRAGQAVTASLGVRSIVATAAVHRGALADGPVMWVVGNVSWPGMQLHGILGPLALGHTVVMTEGTLDVPGPTRAWDVMARHGVTTLVTVPSVLRTIRGWVRDVPDLPHLPHLRRVVSVGEPLDAEVRAWAGHRLAGHRVRTADGWGQVELGGVAWVDQPTDPPYLPDLGMRIVDASGRPVPDDTSGELVLTRPWAGSMLAADLAPSIDEHHWRGGHGPYFTGDWARRTRDGLEFHGRIDEIVSVSGQLVSLAEVQALLADHPYTEAVDVIERSGRDGSRYIAAAVVVDQSTAPGRDPAHVARELNQSVREILGGLACPRLILFVDRFGDELRGDERRRALAMLPVAPGQSAASVTWEQVLQTLGPPDSR